jgi:protein TonB
MGHQTIPAPGFGVRRRWTVPTTTRRGRFVLVAVVLSIGFHLAAALLIVLLPHVFPKEAPPREQGTVELLMVEKKGALPSQAGQPKNDPPMPVPQRKADTPRDENPKAATESPPTQTVPVPPTPAPGDEPATPPTEQAQTKVPKADAPSTEKQTDAQPMEKQAEVPPEPPRSQEAPVFDLAGTDSDSNAIALGNQIVPAMKDDRFRNRPPIYPTDAQTLGQNGTVVVLIHVSENGVATGADVVESSGFEVLDRAAVTAVLKWHFRPAMRDGRTVAFDMPFRFVFEPY